MQQWTPSAHVRIIGAWPSRAKSRSGVYHNLRSFSTAPSHDAQFRARYKTPLEVQGELRTERESLSGGTLEKDGEIEAPDDLPLPPLLRPTNQTNKLMNAKAKRQRRDSEYTPPDVYRSGHQKTLAEKRRRAPFSTAFAENPYAHALSTPVREDRSTGARVPNTCLVDLHLVDNPSAHTTEAQWDRQKGKQAYDNPSTQLMPLSLVAELVSKKKEQKQELSDIEKEAIEARDHEVTSYQPRGAASYLTMRRDALDMVSENPAKRTKKMATGRRTLSSVGNMHIGWRTDMGDFMLNALRKVVVKKMKWLIEGKGTADKPGGVQAMPGLAGLERLDMVDGVSCVLRLRPKLPTEDPPVETGTDLQELKDGFESTSSAETVSISKEANADSESHLAGDAALAEDVAELNPPAPTVIDAASSLPKNPRGPGNEPPVAIPNLAQQQRRREGFWSDKEPFLKHIHVPAPPASPAQIYFPTLPYRNRRVAAYNMQHLLGDEILADLLKCTVFEKVEVVAVTSNIATVGLQVWLLKLAAFLGASKSDTPKV